MPDAGRVSTRAHGGRLVFVVNPVNAKRNWMSRFA